MSADKPKSKDFGRDRERVIAEELARDEARRLLQQRKTLPRRVLEFLGTPLGLWILGAVVIGGLTFAYHKYQLWIGGQAEAAKQLSDIDHEIDSRLGAVRQGIGVVKSDLTAVDNGGPINFPGVWRHAGDLWIAMAKQEIFFDSLPVQIETVGAMTPVSRLTGPPSSAESLSMESLITQRAKLLKFEHAQIEQVESCFKSLAAPYTQIAQFPKLFVNLYNDDWGNQSTPNGNNWTPALHNDEKQVMAWLDGLSTTIDQLQTLATMKSGVKMMLPAACTTSK